MNILLTKAVPMMVGVVIGAIGAIEFLKFGLGTRIDSMNNNTDGFYILDGNKTLIVFDEKKKTRFEMLDCRNIR